MASRPPFRSRSNVSTGDKIIAFLGGLVGIVLVALLTTAMAAWGFMLFIGNVHLEWWEFVPTISYRASLFVMLPVVLVGVGVNNGRSSKS